MQLPEHWRLSGVCLQRPCVHNAFLILFLFFLIYAQTDQTNSFSFGQGHAARGDRRGDDSAESQQVGNHLAPLLSCITHDLSRLFTLFVETEQVETRASHVACAFARL